MENMDKIIHATELKEQRAGVAPLCVAKGMLVEGVDLPGTNYKVALTVGHMLVLARIGNPLIPVIMGRNFSDVRTESEVMMDDLRCMYIVTHSAKECRDLLASGEFEEAVMNLAEELPAAAYLGFGPALNSAISAGFETALAMEARGEGGSGGKRLKPDGRRCCWIFSCVSGIFHFLMPWKRR